MISRRSIFAGLASILGVGALPAQSSRKWYITFSGHGCTNEPIETFVKDRWEAIANSGMTIWSEERWQDFLKNDEAGFKAMCAANKQK